ncbi:MAG: pyruvate kinase [Butyrivibrio sp.]|nr:pyruvate kinase [Butyrivibrio sp.]
MDIFGTIGPSCRNVDILKDMFKEGMTGVRINLSHTMLSDNEVVLDMVKKASSACGIKPKILVDLQGPELRIGELKKDIHLNAKDNVTFITGKNYANTGVCAKESVDNSIPVDIRVLDRIEEGDEILLDDGKILCHVTEKDDIKASAKLDRGGILTGRKSILIRNKTVDMPTLTSTDIVNIEAAAGLGVTGVMQPFVRSKKDLTTLRTKLQEAGGSNIEIYAKIENMAGVEMLDELIPECDEIVIARGDLGNAVPLWELPALQKYIAGKCRKQNCRFMVVTQMLASMEHSLVPTRAEVSDIYNAASDGASSVMVTGETAIGDYPVDVIRFLSKTIYEYERTIEKNENFF